MNIYGAVLTLDESGAPTIGDTGGTLWADGLHAGTERVTFTASDPTSGVATTRLLVDGHAVAEHQQDCDGGRPTPCPPTVADSFDLTIAPLGGGPHTVAIVAVDRAGNASPADGTTHTVNVLGHFPNGAGASPSAKLRALFTRTRHAKLRTRPSGTARISGILRDESNKGIGGAVLEIHEIVSAAGAQATELPQVTTDDKGRFSFVVAPGPSRKVTVAYRAFADDALPTQSRTLTLTVPARIALRASPRRLRNGQRVSLRGRLLTQLRPAGLLINVQAFDRGRWVLVGTIRTAPGGTFAWRYRFKHTRAATTYPFRVQLRRQAGFPYAASYSRAARVRVR
jgi:hypothetical protein